MTLVALSIDPLLAAHLAVAVHRHRQALRAAGRPCPAALADLEELAVRAVKPRQRGTDRSSVLEQLAAVVHADLDGHASLLTQKQVAAALGVHPRTVQRMLDRGDLRSVMVGRRRRVAVAELEAYLTANRRPKEGQ